MTDYKLVPVEPTAEMVKAACDEEQRPLPMWNRMKAIYKAMLAAAPDHIADARKMVAPAVQGEPVSHDWDDHDKCRRCGDRDWYASATCTPKQQPAMEETMDTPDKIWLIDMGDCVAWADDPNPAGMDDDEKPDAVEYVRADTLAATGRRKRCWMTTGGRRW